MLAAMRDSTRPGGVPDELETDAVAAAVADQVWTWDGSPGRRSAWAAPAARPNAALEVAGSTDGMAGADLYTFTVDPATGEVTLELSDLHGYPATLG